MKSHNAFAHRLRNERLLSGRDESGFAAALGISREVLQRFEGGEGRLSAFQLTRAASELDIPLALLCFAESDGDAPVFRTETQGVLWLSVRRPISVLSFAAFERVDPIIRLWQATRGRLIGEVEAVLKKSGMLSRTVVARRVPATSRLVVEFLGMGHKHLTPCEGLLRIGRDIEEMPDRDYGARAAPAYVEVATVLSSRIEAVRALVRTSSATLLNARYDRVLLPWRGRGGEVFVMGLSLRRELSIVG